VTARVHVGGATQVLDPVLVQNQETVPNRHPNEGIARPGVRVRGHWDVFFDIHAYSVQQIHGQPVYKALPLQIQPFSKLFHNITFIYKQKKKSRAHFMLITPSHF
jgi:hypothetical protein